MHRRDVATSAYTRVATGHAQWMESLWDRIKTLHDQGWGDVAIAREVLPRTWFAIGQEFLTLGDLSSLNVVQSALYGPLVRPEVDDVMQRLRQPG